MADRNGSLSGLSEEEAQEMHRFYIQGTIVFTLVAVAAHFLVWFWRPWIPGPDGYAAVSDTATTLASLLTMVS